MKLIGILLAYFGWLLPVVGLGMTSSTGARIVLCIVGIGITLTAILKLLINDHEKKAVWKQ